MQGFLLIDKPAGMTSHDVVDRVRRVTGERTVGHAGTLDPFATGLLLIGVGRACTKRLSEFLGMDKEYIATLKLGAKSDTGDLTGVITQMDSRLRGNDGRGGDDDVETIFKSFLGPQMQTPPMFSAKKVGGKKLYELARAGKEIERQAVPINIYELEEMDSRLRGNDNKDEITFRTKVSSGTYIRTLGEDIAKKLGTEGYLTALQRTKIGDFDIKNAITLESLEADRTSLPFLSIAC